MSEEHLDPVTSQADAADDKVEGTAPSPSSDETAIITPPHPTTAQSRPTLHDDDAFAHLPHVSDSEKIIVAVDAMGGDFGPSEVVPGAVQASKDSGCCVLLVGLNDAIKAELEKCDLKGADVQIVPASQVVDMSEKPSDILRRKKDASIQVACRLVRDGHAHGVISAGHSGATVACGMFIIGRAPGVDRPALAAILPTEKQQPFILLDVGANVDCRPYHLFQFGLMGQAYARDLLNREKPRVGLISIGEEEGKGNSQVKEAYELLRLVEDLNFVGNIEGRDLYTGDIDVAVCDGFTGNVALKLSEGLGSALIHSLKNQLKGGGILAKLGAMLLRPTFKQFAKALDYTEIGGALVLGLRGIAVVCHGQSNAKAMCSATKQVVMFTQKKTNDRLIEAITANEELTRYGRSV